MFQFYILLKWKQYSKQEKPIISFLNLLANTCNLEYTTFLKKFNFNKFSKKIKILRF